MIIEEGTYVKKAEQVIKQLSQNTDRRGNVRWITTSKIRNLLAMSADIYNEVLLNPEKLSDEQSARIDYLRVRFVYEAGRDTDVKNFVEKAQILKALEEVREAENNIYYLIITWKH